MLVRLKNIWASSRSLAEISCYHCSTFFKSSLPFNEGRVWILPSVYPLVWEGDERWIYSKHISSQQDTHNLRKRCGSSEDASCPSFLHEFTALATNEESEGVMLKINKKKKERNIKLLCESNMKSWHKKMKISVLISFLFLYHV